MWQSFEDRWHDAADWLASRWKTLLTLTSVSLLSSAITLNPFHAPVPYYETGQVARENVRALQTIRAIDEEFTAQRRAAAAEQLLDLYDLDPQSKQIDLESILKGFKLLEAQNPFAMEKFRRTFETTLGAPLSEEEWDSLKRPANQRKIRLALDKVYRSLNEFWIIDESTIPQSPEILIRDIRSGEESRVPKRQYQKKILTIREIRNLLNNPKEWKGFDALKLSPRLKEHIVSLVLKLVDADLVFNRVETEERRSEAMNLIEPVWIEIAQGEIIVREGERVNREASILLKAMRKSQVRETNFASVIWFSVILALLIVTFYNVGRRNFRKFKLTQRDQMVMGGFLVASLALLSSLFHLFSAAESQSPIGSTFLYLLPLAFPAMTLRLFTSMEITMFFSMLLAMAVAWMTRVPYFALITVSVSLVGAARMRHISQRVDVIKAGLVVGLLQAALVALGVWMEALDISAVMMHLGVSLLFALLSGLFCAGLILAAQPVIEYLGYTTDLRLMELSSTNHPLLKEMIIKAPGTYFHSFTVSQLAEKAAEAIHGNALFARVAALYHDIGKTKKPHYFIENIKGENKHDKLVPTMSALIISNHVKDGIELAYEHKLPQSIVEIIPQHHGTALISYFYDKAKKQAGEGEEIDEHDFRYPGPKPQTREGAIILLADAVEATAKALPNRSADQLRQMIHATIQRFFLDGQLDECDMSLKDLTGIGNAFLQVLQGVYHQRIDYPHLKKPAEEATERISFVDSKSRNPGST